MDAGLAVGRPSLEFAAPWSCFASQSERVEGIWRPELWGAAVAMAGIGLPLFVCGVRKDQDMPPNKSLERTREG